MAQVGHSYEGAAPHTKGGGHRQSSTRQIGSRPKPGRHIPWPEIFKHHISLIEGHLKMTTMVKKHTIEGSANWHTISSLIDRTKEMLHAAQSQSRIFVPQSDTWDQISVGSPSASIDPGYSPAVDGHQKVSGVKRTRRFGGEAATAASESDSSSETGTESDGLVAKSSEPRVVNGKVESGTVQSPTGGGSEKEPLFVIDLKPTPVNFSDLTTKSPKHVASPSDIDEGKKTKKAKTRHSDGDDDLSLPNEVELEFEDISQEVNARLKEKEEKRKRKKEPKEKKRKNHADVDSDVAAPDASTAVEKRERPKKKKKLKRTDDKNVKDIGTKKRNGTDINGGQGEGKKKKRKKNKEARDS